MRLLLAPLLIVVAAAFRMAVPRAGQVRRASGVRSMTAMFDALAGTSADMVVPLHPDLRYRTGGGEPAQQQRSHDQ